jgi:hypothetical protein
VYSYKDERLLVDIEKLIKQSITRGELVEFNPAPARPPRDAAERSAAPRCGVLKARALSASTAASGNAPLQRPVAAP